ncbi:MAG: hypothetical protein GY804_02980, partial [Alphaproteobacteria bacterium]|nr:hypothetical protein [Alphaproteobacteria bacterium]
IEKAQTEDERNKQSDKLKAIELLITMDNDDEDRKDRRKEKVMPHSLMHKKSI